MSERTLALETKARILHRGGGEGDYDVELYSDPYPSPTSGGVCLRIRNLGGHWYVRDLLERRELGAVLIDGNTGDCWGNHGPVLYEARQHLTETRKFDFKEDLKPRVVTIDVDTEDVNAEIELAGGGSLESPVELRDDPKCGVLLTLTRFGVSWPLNDLLCRPGVGKVKTRANMSRSWDVVINESGDIWTNVDLILAVAECLTKSETTHRLT
jgi:hypothetical protein